MPTPPALDNNDDDYYHHYCYRNSDHNRCRDRDRPPTAANHGDARGGKNRVYNPNCKPPRPPRDSSRTNEKQKKNKRKNRDLSYHERHSRPCPRVHQRTHTAGRKRSRTHSGTTSWCCSHACWALRWWWRVLSRSISPTLLSPVLPRSEFAPLWREGGLKAKTNVVAIATPWMYEGNA